MQHAQFGPCRCESVVNSSCGMLRWRSETHVPVPSTQKTARMNPPAITLYTTAVCPYCVAAKNFFKSKGLQWNEVRVDVDHAARTHMIDITGRTSVPQIFVGETHVGGYDDMMALHRKGGFEPLLNRPDEPSE